MSKHVDGNLGGDVILSGYQKKLNTMKKKFFVLYKETAKDCARLEYYDSIKKFKSGTAPKRVVKLENCFNINRRLDTKHDYVIALATKDGGFGIVLESEAEMSKWLQALLALQRNISIKSELHPSFDHVWQVVVQKKSLAEEKKIIGNYHICLSPKSVTFIRIGMEKSTSGFIRTTNIQIPLNTIRRCGDSHCLFYMEVGRQCIIGPGELLMETEDPLVAQSMHKMISSAMSARTEDNGDNMRKRSSSVTETSKPISFIDTGIIHPENKNYNIYQTVSSNLGRGRCDSFPSRSRESSDYLNQSFKSSHMLNIASCSLSHRSLAMPRYSTSPPLTPPFICPERNESVKLEEQEDTVNYLPFRFKSAERAIPEENSEDLINSDSISFQKEAYIAMAPVLKLLDPTENNKAQQETLIFYDDAAFSYSVNSKNSMVQSDLASQVQPVIISSALSSDLDKEERPKRSYSIGSKMDKNKIKRIGNSNEITHDTNAIRVRAFSVGSRAKIPKGDLQRAVLFPRSRFNQSCISNNSLNFGPDEAAYKSELNTNCDKKSTSAPILIQNGQVQMDCMSDLMEIDFSKSSTHKTLGRPETEKNTECSLNEMKCPLPLKSDFDFSEASSFKAKEQNGYLEMRPVDCVINQQPSPAPACNECVVKMLKSNDNSVVASAKRKEAKHKAHGKYISKAKILDKERETLCLNPKEQDNMLNEENGANQIKEESIYSPCENVTYLSSIYSNLSMQPISNNHTEEVRSFPIFNVEKNVKPSKKSLICNEEYNLKNILSESFQVKNEGLMEAADTEQNSPVKSEKYPAITNAPSVSPGSLTNRCKSSSVTRFNEAQTLPNAVGNRESEILPGNSTIENKALKTNPSVSSPDCSSYGLYYAKLDLPQSSSKESIQFHKTETDISSIISTETDSYAKIDFEHSSDSSSSSKTVIN